MFGLFYKIILLFFVLFLNSCEKSVDPKQKEKEFLLLGISQAGFDLLEEARLKIGQLSAKPPSAEKDTSLQIRLGEKIFKDNTLSLNSVQSCSTCHLLSGRNAGTDGQSVSLGTFGQSGRRNTPSILNVGYLKTMFWDGRVNTLEEQALLPFTDPLEMALPSNAELVHRMQSNSNYVTEFANAFPDSPQVSLENIRSSISSFERSLVSQTRFDQFLAGDMFAISTEEKNGLKLFMNLNCISCHEGPMLGGSKFVKLDTIYSYNPLDLGRYEFTKVDSDKYFFRTPSLRNVALTQPYFHDGSVGTLAEAVRRMNYYDAPRTITEEEVQAIISFLKTLSDTSRPVR